MLVYNNTIIVCITTANSTYNFGRGAAPARIAYVYCSGTESSLAECTYRTGSSISSCLSNRYNDIIGLQCKSGMCTISYIIN